MGLFSFLFDQQSPASGGTSDVATGFTPQDDTPLARTLGPSMRVQEPPHMETQPGLLHNLASHALSPQGMLALGTALRASGGDQNAWSDAADMQNRQLQMAQFQRQLALQQRGNQAFRAAYVTDPKTGQTRFNPQVYAQVMGDALDPKDMVALAKTFAPEEALQDGFITRKDPLTGELTITARRPMSYGEENAASTLAETQRHNGVEEGQGQQRISEDARHNRVGEGISAGQLGVSQSHLGLDQSQQAFERQKFGAAQNPGVPVITSPTDYARLPAGTPYIAPDGSLRHKQ